MPIPVPPGLDPAPEAWLQCSRAFSFPAPQGLPRHWTSRTLWVAPRPKHLPTWPCSLAVPRLTPKLTATAHTLPQAHHCQDLPTLLSRACCFLVCERQGPAPACGPVRWLTWPGLLWLCPRLLHPPPGPVRPPPPKRPLRPLSYDSCPIPLPCELPRLLGTVGSDPCSVAWPSRGLQAPWSCKGPDFWSRLQPWEPAQAPTAVTGTRLVTEPPAPPAQAGVQQRGWEEGLHLRPSRANPGREAGSSPKPCRPRCSWEGSLAADTRWPH